jgi:hypothetical protein
MHEQHLQKGMFVKVENFGIKSKSKEGFEKGDMHVVIKIKSITIVSLILTFQGELIPMFLHMDSIRELAIIVIIVKGVRDSKGEKQLLIANGESEFNQHIFVIGNNFTLKYEQLLEAYNEGQCAMVLIKNVKITSKGDQYLRA